MRRRLLWSLIVLLAALLVVSAGYHATMQRLQRQHEQFQQQDPKYQRLVETAPA